MLPKPMVSTPRVTTVTIAKGADEKRTMKFVFLKIKYTAVVSTTKAKPPITL